MVCRVQFNKLNLHIVEVLKTSMGGEKVVSRNKKLQGTNLNIYLFRSKSALFWTITLDSLEKTLFKTCRMLEEIYFLYFYIFNMNFSDPTNEDLYTFINPRRRFQLSLSNGLLAFNFDVACDHFRTKHLMNKRKKQNLLIKTN